MKVINQSRHVESKNEQFGAAGDLNEWLSSTPIKLGKKNHIKINKKEINIALNKNEASNIIKFPLIHQNNTMNCELLTEFAVFGVSKKRHIQTNEIVYKNNGVIIEVSSQLGSVNQSDLDVLYAIIKEFSESSQAILKDIKLADIKKAINVKVKDQRRTIAVIESIKRLEKLTVFVTKKRIKTEYNFLKLKSVTKQNNGSIIVSIFLCSSIFEMIRKEEKFINLENRAKMKGLVGKWLIAYIEQRLPTPFAITIKSAIKMSGFKGKKARFLFYINKSIDKINSGYYDKVKVSIIDDKITFFVIPK